MLTDLQSRTPQGAPNPPADCPASDANLLAEFRALTQGCGAYSLADRAKISLTGEDRTRWLNGMVTNNIRDLAVDQGVYAFLLNPQGKIQGDFLAFNRGDEIVLDIEGAQTAKLLPIFDHYIVMDDVAVTNASEKLTSIGVQGPKSRAVLRSAGIDVPELLPLQQVAAKWQSLDLASGDLATIDIVIVRAEAWKREAYEIWIDPKHCAHLMQTIAQSGATLVNKSALTLYRIAAGIPAYGDDIRERDLPQETGQERALHYAKGCYVGQEIVERIRSRGQVHRMLTGFELTRPCPSGSKISAEIAGVSKEVGEVTSIASLPGNASKIIALGYLRREAVNQPLSADGSPVKVHPLPFEEILQGNFESVS
jgi:folate-binding protein YgfZ